MSPPPPGRSGAPIQPDQAEPPVRFEDIDWERVADLESRPSWRLRGFLAGLGLLLAGFLYEHVAGHSLPWFENLDPLDWLFAASLLALVTFLVVPLAANPDATARYWRRFRRRPLGLVSLGFVLTFFVVGLIAPVLASEPTLFMFQQSNQPPVGLTVDTIHLLNSDACVGRIENGRCHGTLEHPLGTTHYGRPLLPFVLLGTRTSLMIAVVSATLIVPTGIALGLLAGYAGGRIDQLLMQIAEISQTVPALLIYMLFWGFSAQHRLLLLIGVFGITSWGGLARLVRNEALQLRNRPYVKAARAAGASPLFVVREHLLPNIWRSILTNVTLQIPLLVATEATISFIMFGTGDDAVTLGDPTVVSWGQTIYSGVTRIGPDPAWWVATIPSVVLVLTLLAFTLLGRTIGDVLAPEST